VSGTRKLSITSPILYHCTLMHCTLLLYCREIWQNFFNLHSDWIVDNATLRKLKDFYAEQDKWTRSMIKDHPSDEDAFWRHVAYIMAQFDGICAGYRAAALPEWVRNVLLLLIHFCLHVRIA